jgi:hypothetical protein
VTAGTLLRFTSGSLVDRSYFIAAVFPADSVNIVFNEQDLRLVDPASGGTPLDGATVVFEELSSSLALSSGAALRIRSSGVLRIQDLLFTGDTSTAFAGVFFPTVQLWATGVAFQQVGGGNDGFQIGHTNGTEIIGQPFPGPEYESIKPFDGSDTSAGMFLDGRVEVWYSFCNTILANVVSVGSGAVDGAAHVRLDHGQMQANGLYMENTGMDVSDTSSARVSHALFRLFVLPGDAQSCVRVSGLSHLDLKTCIIEECDSTAILVDNATLYLNEADLDDIGAPNPTVVAISARSSTVNLSSLEIDECSASAIECSSTALTTSQLLLTEYASSGDGTGLSLSSGSWTHEGGQLVCDGNNSVFASAGVRARSMSCFIQSDDIGPEPVTFSNHVGSGIALEGTKWQSSGLGGGGNSVFGMVADASVSAVVNATNCTLAGTAGDCSIGTLAPINWNAGPGTVEGNDTGNDFGAATSFGCSVVHKV